MTGRTTLTRDLLQDIQRPDAVRSAVGRPREYSEGDSHRDVAMVEAKTRSVEGANICVDAVVLQIRAGEFFRVNELRERGRTTILIRHTVNMGAVTHPAMFCAQLSPSLFGQAAIQDVAVGRDPDTVELHFDIGVIDVGSPWIEQAVQDVLRDGDKVLKGPEYRRLSTRPQTGLTWCCSSQACRVGPPKPSVRKSTA